MAILSSTFAFWLYIDEVSSSNDSANDIPQSNDMDLGDIELEFSLCSEDDEVMNHYGTKTYNNDISSNDSKGSCGYGNGIDDLVHESDLEDEENTARQNSLIESQAEEGSSEESTVSINDIVFAMSELEEEDPISSVHDIDSSYRSESSSYSDQL
jgi:hypothetical protein